VGTKKSLVLKFAMTMTWPITKDVLLDAKDSSLGMPAMGAQIPLPLPAILLSVGTAEKKEARHAMTATRMIKEDVPLIV